MDSENAKMLDAIRRSHYQQRLQLELTLETIPRDSRYSAQLIDLMKREEMAIRDNTDPKNMRDLIQRVDDALRTETERFFNKTVQQNVKRWETLQKKTEGEVQRLLHSPPPEVTTSPQKNCAKSDAACTKPPVDDSEFNYRIPTAAEMDRETLRLEEDYNQNWLRYEGHNLQSAFQSQIARVESDWISQEMALTDDFDMRKAQLTGSFPLDSPTRATAAASDRWQHPEKQKTLIHTAPVLSPTINRTQEPQTADLERLHRQYRAAMDNLERQKAAAVRWMGRQEIRLVAQCKESAVERRAISAVIRQELSGQ